jgi:hypothetical protein
MTFLVVAVLSIAIVAILVLMWDRTDTRIERPAYAEAIAGAGLTVLVATTSVALSLSTRAPGIAMVAVLLITTLVVTVAGLLFARRRGTSRQRAMAIATAAGTATALLAVMAFWKSAPSSGPSDGPPALVITRPRTREDRIREWLAKGAAVFNPKTQMTQGREETVTLRIAQHPRDPFLHAPMAGGPATLAWSQDVSLVMRAELKGNGFEIEQVTPADQFLRNGHYEWSWNVTPTKWGKRKLRLTTAILAPIPGLGEKASVANVTTRTVEVMVNPKHMVSGFFATYWQWLATTLLIPVAIWLWKKLSAKKNPIGYRIAG